MLKYFLLIVLLPAVNTSVAVGCESYINMSKLIYHETSDTLIFQLSIKRKASEANGLAVVPSS